MSVRTLRLVCCLMLGLFPANMALAEAEAAMAMVSGVAALNGTALSNSSAIFSGDLLETGPNSALTINASGSTVLIGANSRVHFFGDAVQLHVGSTQVSTSKGMKIESDTVTVEPNKTSAKYRVDRSAHVIVIAALSEEVRVNNNGEITIVPQGGTLTLQERDDREAAGPVSGPSNRKIFVIVAAGVGGAAAILFIDKDKKTPISNQVP